MAEVSLSIGGIMAKWIMAWAGALGFVVVILLMYGCETRHVEEVRTPDFISKIERSANAADHPSIPSLYRITTANNVQCIVGTTSHGSLSCDWSRRND